MRRSTSRKTIKLNNLISLYLRALKYAAPYKGRLAATCFLSLLVSTISLAPLIALKLIVDKAFSTTDPGYMNAVLIWIVGASVVGLVLDFVLSTFRVNLFQDIKINVVVNVFEHLQKLPLRFFDTRRLGELMYRVHTDTNALEATIGQRIINLFSNAITLLVIIVLMLWLNKTLTLVSFVIMMLHVVLVISFQDAIAVYSRKLVEADEVIFAETSEYLSSIRTIRVMDMQRYELKQFYNRISKRNAIARSSNITNLSTGSIVAFLNTIWIVLLLWLGGKSVMTGSLTIGGMMVFFIIASRMFAAISSLTQWVLSFQSNLVGVDRVFNIIDEDIEAAEEERGKDIPPLKGGIRFDRVSFEYVQGKTVLKDISFDLAPGMTAALVGRSGAGKTTLVNLLLKFYQPNSGEIFVDEHRLSEVSSQALRRQLGVVLQEPSIFRGTVTENLMYGAGREVSREEIIAAAKAANANDFVTNLPNGYETMLGERAAQLSTGEKQRIAIARALLRNPRVLILDEATSALDLQSESLIQDALKRLIKDRTTLIVAHRLSTIKAADIIFVLDEGIIKESGTHDELVAKSGIYSMLYQRVAWL